MHAPTASSKPRNWSIRMPDPTAIDPLVPRHRGFDGFGMAWDGQVFGGEEHLDAARHPRLAADEAETLQREHHLGHARRADPEMALHVALGRWPAVDPCVGID